MSTKKETEEVMRSLQRRKKAASKRHKQQRILIGVAIAVAAILALLGIIYCIFSRYYNMMNYVDGTDEVYDTIAKDDDYDPTATDSAADIIQDMENNIENNVGQNEIVFHDGVYNLLIIGTDSRDIRYDRGRSDSIIILSINENLKTITVTSVMRDTYLHIPGLGNNRINAAYSYGGASMLVDTIAENLSINIDNYVITNFTVFKDIIDLIGGVDIEISQAEIDVMNGYIREYNNKIDPSSNDDSYLSYYDAGMAHLNGKQALAYCRVRYVGNGDFDRTARQREVIEEMFKKCKKMSVSELDELAKTVLPWLTVDLTMTDAMTLAGKAITSYMDYELQSSRLPADDTWYGAMIDGMSVLSIDFAANRDVFFQTVYGKTYEELIG